MTDLQLYRLIKGCCNEYHDDGIFFIPPWNIENFTTGLSINDSEHSVASAITTDGYLAVDTHEFESWFEEDIEDVIKMLYSDLN